MDRQRLVRYLPSGETRYHRAKAWTMNNWLGLQGRACLVAGAGGIGAACALGLLGAGARVVAIDIDADNLRQLQESAHAAGAELKVVVADLSSAESCRGAMDEAVA